MIYNYYIKTKEDYKMKTGIREIKKSVTNSGGTFVKEKFYLNGNDAYRVNGKLYTKYELIEAYKMGDL